LPSFSQIPLIPSVCHYCSEFYKVYLKSILSLGNVVSSIVNPLNLSFLPYNTLIVEEMLLDALEVDALFDKSLFMKLPLD
jgi:hypothetical protein